VAGYVDNEVNNGIPVANAKEFMCKGNLMNILSQDDTCREESPTELALPVATHWQKMLDEPNQCNGAQAHVP
jgi:hypothetical protein